MQMPAPDQAAIARRDLIVARLIAALSAAGDAAARVIAEPAEILAYECDALSAYRCPPLAVVLPSTTAGVAAALRLCHEERVPVVPRGAGPAWPAARCPRPTRW